MRLPQIFTKTSYLNRTTVVYDLVRKKYQTFNKIYEIKEACTHNYIVNIYIIKPCILFAHIFTVFCL